MTEDHPNVALLKRLDLRNIAESNDLISEKVIWHYANPNLPDLQGDHHGLDGVRSFFDAIAYQSSGTFKINPVSVTPVGDDLVVVQSENCLTYKDRHVTLGVVIVWRFVEGQVVEVWDIVSGDAKETLYDHS